MTAVSGRVVGAEAGDLHGTVQRTGSVSWQRDAAPESLIHLDYITFGTEKRCFVLFKGSIERLLVSLKGGGRGRGRGGANSERVLLERLLKATVIGLVHDAEDR